MMDGSAKEKLANMIGNCCKEFSCSATGIKNLSLLSDLLKKLYLCIFLRAKEMNEFLKQKDGPRYDRNRESIKRNRSLQART